MFQHVDVVIAFVVLMLVASLFITAATQGVIGLLGLRGANLRRSLADLLETAYPDQETRHWSKEIAGRVLRHPTVSDSIFSHFRVRAERLPFLPPETAGKLQGISASIPLLPWIMGGVGGFFLTPIVVAIAKGLFGAVLCQYSDVLAGYVSAINFCDHPLRTGLLVGAILGGLLSRWRVATSIRVEELPAALEKLADRKSTRLNSSHSQISYAVFCLKKKKNSHAARPLGSQVLLHLPSRPRPVAEPEPEARQPARAAPALLAPVEALRAPAYPPPARP